MPRGVAKNPEEKSRKLRVAHLGKTLSEEHKRKIGDSGCGRIVSDITKERIRVAATGRKHTEATKRRLSEINKGKKLSPDHLKKFLNGDRERKYSKERNRKISIAMLGKTNFLGKTHSEETKRKMRRSRLRCVDWGISLVVPSYNAKACKCLFIPLNALLADFGIPKGFHAEDGGEFKVGRYFVDYYNRFLRLVIEFDERGHYCGGVLRRADLDRQTVIEKELRCQFIRVREGAWNMDSLLKSLFSIVLCEL